MKNKLNEGRITYPMIKQKNSLRIKWSFLAPQSQFLVNEQSQKFVKCSYVILIAKDPLSKVYLLIDKGVHEHPFALAPFFTKKIINSSYDIKIL